MPRRGKRVKDSNAAKTFGACLHQIIKRHLATTQSQLAHVLGVSPTLVGLWCSGKIVPQNFDDLIGALISIKGADSIGDDLLRRLREAYQIAIGPVVGGETDEQLVSISSALSTDLAAAGQASLTAAAPLKGSVIEPRPASLLVRPTSNLIEVRRIFGPSMRQNLVGREGQIQALDEAWSKAHINEPGRPHILAFVAFAGEGKTSIVAHWIARLANRGWHEGEIAFAWSFYNQGHSGQSVSSSDLFLSELTEFLWRIDPTLGDDVLGGRGRALARVLSQQPVLLVLDGLEPLQFSPSEIAPGQLKDSEMANFLGGLAANNSGLCIVTTRYPISDLRAYQGWTVHENVLPPLSTDAGVELLKKMGVKIGSEDEFIVLVAAAKGHALTLTLIGSYLKRAFGGDIRQRYRVNLDKADRREGGHAFRVMAAYEKWLRDGGEEGRREIAILRLTGLFDRPADAASLRMLCETAIGDLNADVMNISDEQWNIALDSLEGAKLVAVIRGYGGEFEAIDAHPLVREYFTQNLKANYADSHKIAHLKLFESFKAGVIEQLPAEARQLDRAYLAIRHGCLAGEYEEAFDLYLKRVCWGDRHLSISRFGFVYQDILVLWNFFQGDWSQPVSELTSETKERLLSLAGFRLRTAGRFSEAAIPMEKVLAQYSARAAWERAVEEAGNLAVLYSNAGKLELALDRARRAVSHAEQSGSWKLISARLATLGEVLIQFGPERQDEAYEVFRKAEKIQRENEPLRPVLFSTKGYRFHELMLDVGEYDEVIKRIQIALDWRDPRYELLDEGLMQLMRGRALLARAVDLNCDSSMREAAEELERALYTLKKSRFVENIIRALLAQAEYFFVKDAFSKDIKTNLDEARELSRRHDPMPLFQTDIYLCRVRSYVLRAQISDGRPSTYPWDSTPAKDIAEARRLIYNSCYWRRQQQLDSLEFALASLPSPKGVSENKR